MVGHCRKNKSDSLAAEYLIKGYKMDTSKPELLSEAAMSYNHLKKYNKALDIYNQKISLKEANALDYYYLGKVYYNLQQWGKLIQRWQSRILCNPILFPPILGVLGH